MDIGSIHPHAAALSSQSMPQPERLAETRELIQAVKALNGSEMFGENSELSFALDRETHRPLLRIVDRKTKEVIRQIPPEYVLRMAADLRALNR